MAEELEPLTDHLGETVQDLGEIATGRSLD